MPSLEDIGTFSNCGDHFSPAWSFLVTRLVICCIFFTAWYFWVLISSWVSIIALFCVFFIPLLFYFLIPSTEKYSNFINFFSYFQLFHLIFFYFSLLPTVIFCLCVVNFVFFIIKILNLYFSSWYSRSYFLCSQWVLGIFQVDSLR